MVFDGWKRKKQIRALETLVDTKYEKMYRIAFNYTHSKEDALDVIQESFVKRNEKLFILKKMNMC